MADQIVLVTGATGGIGRQTALHLARLGHRVLATGRKSERLAALEAEAEGLKLETFQLDLSDGDSIRAARDEVDGRTDGYGLDVLVNNAGFGNMAPMELISQEDMRGQFETNVFGLVELTQQFLPAMRARGSGKVINISSVVGRVAFPLQGIYCATKHAVEALSDAWRMELRSFGIFVSMVEPGMISTSFLDTATSTADKYSRMESPYAPAIAKYQASGAAMYAKAPGPRVIAKTVAGIIRKRKPKARFVSPWFNRMFIWFVKKLPTSWADALFRRAMGLTPKALSASER